MKAILYSFVSLGMSLPLQARMLPVCDNQMQHDTIYHNRVTYTKLSYPKGACDVIAHVKTNKECRALAKKERYHCFVTGNEILVQQNQTIFALGFCYGCLD